MATTDVNLAHNLTLLGPEYLYSHLGVGITYILLVVVFILFGTLGNTLVISAVIINKNLRTVGNTFIVNLAIADICVTGFVDPLAIVGFVAGEEYFIMRPALCESIASICLTSCFCSLLSIGAISVNRYIHICHHHSYDAIYTKNKTIFMNITLWVVSFLLEMGCFIGWGDHIYDRKTMSCVYDRLADYSFTIFFCSVGVGTPLLIIFLCYIHIYIFVRQSKKRIQDGSSNRSDRPKTSELRFVKTIMLIVCIFIACWVPYVTVVLYDRYDRLSPTIHAFSVTAAHMSSSLNFILYGVTNRHFKHAYFRVLYIFDVRRLWQKNNPNSIFRVPVIGDPTSEKDYNMSGTNLADSPCPSNIRQMSDHYF